MLIRAMIFAALVMATGAWCKLSPSVSGGSEAGVIMKLPMKLSSYEGEPEEPSEVEKVRLPADTEFAKAEYHTPTADATARDVVHCTIVLSGTERKSIHRPEVCLQGQDWKLINSTIIPVDMGNGRTLKVKDLHIERVVALKDGSQRTIRAHYVYWFVGSDVTTPSHVERIWLTLWDNIFRNTNHRWAYTSMMALVTENVPPSDSGQRVRNSQETVDIIVKLIQELAPKFQKSFMP
jgi:hypothetical protein